MNPLEWKEISRSAVYDGRIFTAETVVRESYDGKTASFTVLNAPDWVNIIAPVTGSDGVPLFLMVRQFRQGSGRLTVEFPAGTVEPGEEPIAAAAREFEEETGWRADQYRLLGYCNPNPAFMNNNVYTFLAEGARPVSAQHLDEHESIDLVFLPEEELLQILGSGEADNGIMLVAAFWYLKDKKANRRSDSPER